MTKWKICYVCGGSGLAPVRIGDNMSVEFLTYLRDKPCTFCNETGKVREVDDVFTSADPTLQELFSELSKYTGTRKAMLVQYLARTVWMKEKCNNLNLISSLFGSRLFDRTYKYGKPNPYLVVKFCWSNAEPVYQVLLDEQMWQGTYEPKWDMFSPCKQL